MAHSMVLKSEARKTDPEIQKLPILDILVIFEDYSRIRESSKNREERKTREEFKVSMALISHSMTLNDDHVRLQALLQELVDQGEIKAGSKWKAVYPLFKDDERYTYFSVALAPAP